MSLVDALNGAGPRNPSPPRAIKDLREALGDEELEAFEKALNDPKRVSSRNLAKILSSAGHSISANSILKYRRQHGIA